MTHNESQAGRAWLAEIDEQPEDYNPVCGCPRVPAAWCRVCGDCAACRPCAHPAAVGALPAGPGGSV